MEQKTSNCRVEYFPDYDMLYINMKSEAELRELSKQSPFEMGTCKHMHNSARFDCKKDYTDPTGLEVDYPRHSFGFDFPFPKDERFPDQKITWYLSQEGYYKLQELFQQDEYSLTQEELQNTLHDILDVD